MEQNVRNLGVFVAALAMIASVLIVPSVSADGHDLEISGSGDDGITSYASKHGTAVFTISISSMSGSAHNNVAIAASTYWGDDEEGVPITSEATVIDGSSGCPNSEEEDVDTSFGEGGMIDACVYVTPADGGVDVGDDGDLTVSVTSDEDSVGVSMEFGVKVANWVASSSDGAQSYEEGDDDEGESCEDSDSCNVYTINVKNIYVDENGNSGAISDTITVGLSTATPGWNIDSDDMAWNKIELRAEINYIAADGDYDLILDIQLVGEIVPASSYIGNSFVVFSVSDESTQPQFVSLEAIVADNFNVNVVGSGNYDSDSGCSDNQDGTGWTPTIKNFGNTMDSFTYSFDTSDVPSDWTVDGATGGNTGNLNPKFEHDESDGTGLHTVSVGMSIPGGLPAGTSHGFTMTAVSDTDDTVTQTQEFSITVTQCFGIVVSVDKTTDSANPGASSDFTVTVENTGNGEDTVSLMTMGASAWSPSISESELTIASDATAQTVLSMTDPSDARANAQSGMAMVHALSEVCDETIQIELNLALPHIRDWEAIDCDHSPSTLATGFEDVVNVGVTANQVYDLEAGYYTNETDVEMSSASVQEGLGVQMKFTITNNGNGNDEVTLSLENAPAWATLSQDTALIGPGQTWTGSVDIMAPGSDAIDDYTFQVKATSADEAESATTGDLTVSVTEKVESTGGQETEELEEDDSPGFGIVSAIAALGAVLLIRRRS